MDQLPQGLLPTRSGPVVSVPQVVPGISHAAFDAGKLKFFHTLEPLWERRAFLRTLAPLWNAKWVVHAKRPSAGPEQVLDYVGRYTLRVAISKNRLESMDDANVRFAGRIIANTTGRKP